MTLKPILQRLAALAETDPADQIRVSIDTGTTLVPVTGIHYVNGRVILKAAAPDAKNDNPDQLKLL